MRIQHFLVACVAATLALISSQALAGFVAKPNQPITIYVDATKASAQPTIYPFTLTQDDTITLTAIPTYLGAPPCLQAGAYCTNAAGVVTVAGTSPIGGSSLDYVSGLTFGALTLQIEGVPTTVQLFPTDAANGLGNGSPPSSLTLAPTTFAALGFGAFSVINQDLDFLIDDTERDDNSGGFTINLTIDPVANVPEPESIALLSAGAVSLALARRRRRCSSLMKAKRRGAFAALFLAPTD